MQNTNDIQDRLADAYGKRERLISTLGRHKVALEKQEKEFAERFKQSPDDNPFFDSEQAFWAHFAIVRKRELIAQTELRIAKVDDQILNLKEKIFDLKLDSAGQNADYSFFGDSYGEDNNDDVEFEP